MLRVYVRNLRTGEEHYLNDASQIGELVERGLDPAAAALEATDERSYKVG